jgi:hypothetical protein
MFHSAATLDNTDAVWLAYFLKSQPLPSRLSTTILPATGLSPVAPSILFSELFDEKSRGLQYVKGRWQARDKAGYRLRVVAGELG